MNRQEIFDYYSNDKISSILVKNSKEREVAGAFFDGTYDSRPNALQFATDVTQMAKKGVVSFHFSVEHWKNPMAIQEKKYDKLRSGWDLLIDIDSKLGLEESKAAVMVIHRFLEKYGIKNYGIKFSGRRGFHICLPWAMFPKEINYGKAELMYPGVPRILSSFLRDKISDALMKELLKKKSAKELIATLEEPPSSLSPYFFVEVEKNWGNRHMFRAPFSLNEKTWLVSLPMKYSDVVDFSAEKATPQNALISTFEDFFVGEENEAEAFLIDAMDWNSMQQKEKPKPAKKIYYENKMPAESFPPCIKTVLSGLADGRKRSLFTLINFLRMMNWPWQEVEQTVFEWNEKNKPPLPRNIIVSQLRWCQINQRTPSNCPPDGEMYYVSTGICHPDEICKAGTDKIVIKNPIVYPFKKIKRTKKAYRGYSCSQCKKEFKSMTSLSIHKSRMHGVYES